MNQETNNKKQKWVVTAAWPYVNATPHLGTILQLLSADVFARYRRQQGDEVVCVSGSDSHGTPITVAAQREGIPPEELSFAKHEEILNILREWRIEYENYTITHTDHHIRFIQDFYRKCFENGFIFEKTEKQLYCNHDKMFLPDRYVEGICPVCGAERARGDQCTASECGAIYGAAELIEPKCVICGNTPKLQDTTHWYFDFGFFTDELTEFISNHKILSNKVKQEALNLIKDGIPARSITRDLIWGVPAEPIFGPKAANKSIYVWFEAVLGYISATAEYFNKEGESPDKWKEFWFEKDTKLIFAIGKDNLIFHLLIFPALVLGTKEPYILPYQSMTTQFLMFEGKAFSKSHGIGIWGDEATNLLPSDYWRFVLIANRPENRDTNFYWTEFEKLVNSGLNDSVGNFINRAISLVHRYFDGIVPSIDKEELEDLAFAKEITNSVSAVQNLLDVFSLKDGLLRIIALASEGNSYFSSRQPWHLIKEQPNQAKTVLNLGIQLAHALGALLAPFTPDASERIFKQLNLSENPHRRAYSSITSSSIPAGHQLGKPEPLFVKIDAKELEQQLIDNRKTQTISTKEEDKKSVNDQEEVIDYSHFSSVKMVVGTIEKVEEVEGAEKLLKLQVNIGEEIRQIVAGIRQYYSPDQLLNRQVIVVKNLKPIKLRGEYSNGMLLAADEDGAPILLGADRPVNNGTIIK